MKHKKLTQKELTILFFNSDQFKAYFFKESGAKLEKSARYYAGKYVNLLNFCNGENRPTITATILETGQIKKIETAHQRWYCDKHFESCTNDIQINGVYKNGRFEFVIFSFCADLLQFLNISQTS